MLPSSVTKEIYLRDTKTIPGIVMGALDKYPDSGGRCLDFGCDLGLKTLGYAMCGKFSEVVGVDVQNNYVNLKNVHARFSKFPDFPPNLSFLLSSPEDPVPSRKIFDCIISWSVFEHIDLAILANVVHVLHGKLARSGYAFIQVNPLFYSPMGAHLWGLLEPWEHLDSDASVKRLIFERADSEARASAAWELFGTLNRLRLEDFRQLFFENGFECLDERVGKTDLTPPLHLRQQYSEEDLRTEGFQFVLRREERARNLLYRKKKDGDDGKMSRFIADEPKVETYLAPRKIVYSKKHVEKLVDYPIRDIDSVDLFMEIFSKARDYTMTGKDAMFALHNACRYVHTAGIPGAFVECGTWMGGSAILAGLTFQALGEQRDLWLYDTFAGMTAPTVADVDINGANAGKLMETYGDEVGWCYASLEQVKKNFIDAGLLADTAHFIKGDVLETLRTNLPEQISVLRLDTDWYESTRLELELLYPRLAPGGVLIIDDYGYWSGSRKATDEYFAGIRAPMLNRVNDQVRLCIKI